MGVNKFPNEVKIVVYKRVYNFKRDFKGSFCKIKTKNIPHYGLEFHQVHNYVYKKKVEKFLVLILYMDEVELTRGNVT